jgi:endo-1,4-beta-mannosidase
MPTFTLGVNYWPRRSAMGMWRRFDVGEVREDMARIRSLGLQLVRFFVTWDDFSPSADALDESMLKRFDAFMQAVADAGLRAMPTLFCGHMSGVNWLPAWALDRSTPHGRFRTISGGVESPFGIGDFYADPALLAAQTFFARRIGERAAGHPALYLWDVGNEFSNLREPRSPDDAYEWSKRLAEALVQSSHVGATGGTHGEDVERDRLLRLSLLAQPWSIATMHGYSVYATFSRDRTDTDVVPFYARLAQAFSGKPLLFSEFGNPTCLQSAKASNLACLNEHEMTTYAERVLEHLHALGAIGALWWCWADYDPALADQPPFDRAQHELTFGIVRSDGSYKPIAKTLATFAAQTRDVRPALPPIADEASFYADLPGSIDALYRHYRS